MGLDAILVQEQYSQAHHIVQCGPDSKAGLYIHRRDLGCSTLPSLSTTHCFVAHLEGCGVDVHVVSAYFQYSDPIDPHLHHLEGVIGQLRGANIIVGVDANAHSPLWHSLPHHYTGRGHEAEHRRASMEAFILAHRLVVLNTEGQPTTFSGPNGESNIDVTLATRGVRTSEWTVIDGASTSDHRLIAFQVSANSTSRSAEPNDEPVRFRDVGVDWPRFQRAIHARMGKLNFAKPAPVVCKKFMEVIVRSANECLGAKGPPRNAGYEWWCPELDRLRAAHCKVRRKWRKWQDSRKAGGLREARLREEFHIARARYRKAMGEAELKYFRQIAESGNEEPWGLAYRAASGRLTPPPRVLNGIVLAEGLASTVGDAATSLMRALCPDDNPALDTLYHAQVRVAASLIPSGRAAPPLPRGELQNIVRSLPNTAPGLDGISAKIVKRVWAAVPAEFTAVYGKCVEEGVFPDVWKDGRLLVLPKGNGRPLDDPKAYRPITLLPVLGKILERVILRCAPMIGNQISPCQHGFSPGRSTVTALSEIIGFSRDKDHSKYGMAIFLDIAGAFDNAWWPMMLTKVKRGGCPPNIYRMLADYFSRRRVGLFVGTRVEWKVSTMGCPQGSVLGPALWNLLMDDLLRLPLPEGVRMVAYADDVTILIGSQSRAGLEQSAKTVLDLVEQWGARNRLGFSPAKSSMMMIRGRLQRAPVVRMAGMSVRCVESSTILGVVLDTNMSFARHAVSIGERAAKCFGKMSRVSASSWGIRYAGLRVLYRGTFVATITYAAACWYRRAALHVVRSALLRAQRPSLVLLTKAYRSTSTAALAVLGGVFPADLEVVRAGRVEEERLAAAQTQVDLRTRRKMIGRRKKEIWNEMVEAWQTRWTSEEKGRELFRFFPEVSVRLKSHWVAPDYQTAQILTGHGCFRKRLHDMKLSEVSECYCGMAEEDLHHVLWECPLYEEIRRAMMDGISRTEEGPIYYGDLVSAPANFSRLRDFAHRWHDARSAMEKT